MPAVTEPPGLLIYSENILIRVLCFQIKQLSHDQRSGRVVYFIAQHDNAVIQQTGVNIKRTLAAAGLLYDHRN